MIPAVIEVGVFLKFISGLIDIFVLCALGTPISGGVLGLLGINFVRN